MLQTPASMPGSALFQLCDHELVSPSLWAYRPHRYNAGVATGLPHGVRLNMLICSFTNLLSGPILEAKDTLGNKTSISCSPEAQSRLSRVWEDTSRCMLTSGDRECGEETQGRAEREAGEEAVPAGAAGQSEKTK